jgi:hypothetical protein
VAGDGTVELWRWNEAARRAEAVPEAGG